MEVRDKFKDLIDRLIDEINTEGEVMIITGGSDEKPQLLKHDRTVSLKNYLSCWKSLSEIYPDTTERANLKDIRSKL